MRKLFLLAAGLLGGLVLPGFSQAQGITITPQIGVYVPGDDFESLRAGADSIRVDNEGTLALGFNVDLGFLRGSVAYASAAKLNRRGISGQDEIGEGKLLAVAGDLVLRPIPRILILQPYLLAGAGLRRADYDYDDDGISDAFPENESDFALHAGIGADIMLGPIGIAAEITDFISKNQDDEWKRHDGFGFVGVKLRL